MDRDNLLDRLEHGLERSLEVPFERAAPFDAMTLKRRFLRAAEETGSGRAPDRWHLRLPPAMAPHERDVRALMFALWRSLVTERDGEQAVAARRPSVQIAYDPELAADEVMVGFEPAAPLRVHYVNPSPAAPLPPPAPPARPLRPVRIRRPGRLLGAVLPWAFAAVLVVAILSLTSRSGGAPVLAPAFTPPAAPGLSLSPVHYVARIELNVRREPSPNAEVIGVVPAGERLAVFPYNIVEGEPVAGEPHWVEVSPLPRYVLGERRYVWYGGLAPR